MIIRPARTSCLRGGSTESAGQNLHHHVSLSTVGIQIRVQNGDLQTNRTRKIKQATQQLSRQLGTQAARCGSVHRLGFQVAT